MEEEGGISQTWLSVNYCNYYYYYHYSIRACVCAESIHCATGAGGAPLSSLLRRYI